MPIGDVNGDIWRTGSLRSAISTSMVTLLCISTGMPSDMWFAHESSMTMGNSERFLLLTLSFN
jgi:hypothetical protein